MTAALLRWLTVPRLNSHSNPSSTGEISTAKKKILRYLDSNPVSILSFRDRY